MGGLGVGYAKIKYALEREKEVLEREQQSLYFQQIKTAARDIAAGNQARAEQSLENCRADCAVAGSGITSNGGVTRSRANSRLGMRF